MTAQTATGGAFRILRAIHDAWRHPNPVWIRELRQASRIKRTPFVLMTITVIAAITMGAVSGSTKVAPAAMGAWLYQVFFSMAFFVVALVGPAVGANNIASEREGKTWEPLILTGFPARAMARGKFLSSLTSVLQYIAILAPVGALPFLFGGVSATEVVLAFLCLILFSALGVGFGLAVGSSIPNGRTSIVVAIVCAAIVAVFAYWVLGFELSRQAHAIWEVVPSRRPVWFPTALAIAELSTRYLILLVLQPFIAVLGAGWLFYEVTVANMTSAFKDRSSGLLRWFTITTPLLAVALGAPLFIDAPNWLDATAGRALATMACFLVLTTLLFQSVPARRSHRGPGMMHAMARSLEVGIVCFALLTGAAVVLIANRVSVIFVQKYVLLVVCSGGHLGSFLVFFAGLGSWLRTRTAKVGAARVWLMVALLAAVAGPFVVAALTGAFSEEGAANMALAALSPAYALVRPEELYRAAHHEVLVRTAVSGVVWTATGLLFFALALLRQRPARR